MPKYIKDGAYTIVVEERAVSPKRTASPKNLDGNQSDEGEDEKSVDEGEMTGEEDGINFGGEEDEEEIEEEIDYADTGFILQNLSIATPNFAADTTRLLPGREELAGVICSQVRYYCYCAIDSFSRNPRPVTILIIGEGFIGSRIINDLIHNGCKDMLRICTRGDLTAEEWRARNVKAHNNIVDLLAGERPDIVIITVENASFTAVCKQLITNNVINEATFVISCSFGFQRRKLFAQLRSPHIFRTFIEPEEIFNAYKKKAFTSLLAFMKPPVEEKKEKDFPCSDSISTAGGGGGGERLPNVPEDAFIPLDDSRPQSRAATKDEEMAAASMAKRYLDTRNLLHQLENYYAVRHHGFLEARHRAMKNVYGIVIEDHGIDSPIPVAASTLGHIARRSSTDEALEQHSIRRAVKTEAKLQSKVEAALTKLTQFHQCVHTYRNYFVSLLTSRDLQGLKAQTYTREQNNPKSGPMRGYERHRTVVNGMPAPKIVMDLPGRSMYERDFLEGLLRLDEDYSQFDGPGFDLMTSWDKKAESVGHNLRALQAISVPADHRHNNYPSGQRGQSDHHGGAARASHLGAHTQGGHAGGGGGRPSHQQQQPRVPTKEEREQEAQRDLHEYGLRLSQFADQEGTNIDRNYMQKYLEASSAKH